jgi:hypothetical protein
MDWWMRPEGSGAVGKALLLKQGFVVQGNSARVVPGFSTRKGPGRLPGRVPGFLLGEISGVKDPGFNRSLPAPKVIYYYQVEF